MPKQPGTHAFRALLKSLKEKQQGEVEQDPGDAGSQLSQKEKQLQNLAAARAAKAAKAAKAKAASREGESTSSQESFADFPVLTFGSKMQQQLAQSVAKLMGQLRKQESSSTKESFRYIFQEKRPVTGLAAEAGHRAVGRRAFTSFLQEAACFVVLFASYLVGSMLTGLGALVAEGTDAAILLCVKRTYDETPSKITTTSKDPAKKKRSKQEGSTAKVLQTRGEVLILMRRKTTDEHYVIRCPLPTHLQAVDRTTAENTRACQQTFLAQVPGLKDFGDQCLFNIGLVTTDKYGANLKCEQTMGPKGINSANSHYTCDIHKLATCQSKTLKLTDGHISAQIAAAICFSEAGSTRALRKSLLKVLSTKLYVCFGVCPRDEFALAYRQKVLDTFLPQCDWDEESGDLPDQTRKRKIQQQRLCVQYFFHSDLQDKDQIFFWTTHWGLEKKEVLQVMEEFLVPYLLPCKPPIFSRSRWNGFQGALRWFGLLEMCHGLLKPTLQDYLGDRAVPLPVPVAEAEAPQALHPLTLGQEGQEDEQRDASEQHVQEMNLATGDLDWKAFRLQMQQKVRLWMHEPIGPALAVMATAVDALCYFFNCMLDMGSKEWERSQQAEVAQGKPRTYPVLEAARGTLLQKFRAEINKHFHERMALITRDDHLRQFQVLLFRMLSISMCSVEFYVGTAWHTYPVQLFSSLDGHHQVLRDKECMWCPLTKLLASTYSTEQELSGVEAQSILRCVASIFELDIADLESRHATTRRVTAIHSIQTHSPDLALLNADWVCRNNVIDRASSRVKSTCSTKEGAKERPQDKEKSYRANAWNAFMSDRCTQKIAKGEDMAKLKREYRLLSQEEKQFYQSMAEVAKCAAERGMKPYAPVRLNSSPSDAMDDGGTLAPLGTLVEATSAVGTTEEVAAQALVLACDEVQNLLAGSNAEYRRVTRRLASFTEVADRSIEQFHQDESCLQRPKQCCPAAFSRSVPSLDGLHSFRLHMPADDFGEAWPFHKTTLSEWERGL